MAVMLKDQMIAWLQEFFRETGAAGAVVGISGGKDSSVVAALLTEALGKERVYGVLMPNGIQADIQDSKDLVAFLDIPHTIIDIGAPYTLLMHSVAEALKVSYGDLSPVATVNTAPRLRMATLYAVAAQLNYLVAGTGNRSERFVGYFTKWGDGGHDFNVLAELTCAQVIQVGHELRLPAYLVDKAPSDGLTGATDEDNLGVTYAQINSYMLLGDAGEDQANAIISKRHSQSAHKRQPIPTFKP